VRWWCAWGGEARPLAKGAALLVCARRRPTTRPRELPPLSRRAGKSNASTTGADELPEHALARTALQSQIEASSWREMSEVRNRRSLDWSGLAPPTCRR
jgi:hypothetical protein